ncbi:hypothetical protein FORC065_2577 [Yersinia enterocolitica]|nr:hypothetical protein FORC065_2577 [Yersinia enterocolitica]
MKEFKSLIIGLFIAATPLFTGLLAVGDESIWISNNSSPY